VISRLSIIPRLFFSKDLREPTWLEALFT